MENSPVQLKLRIDWSELDLFGHVNNVNFFKYVQASRVNYWENISLIRFYTEKKIGPMLASTSCQFKKPIFYPGNIVIKANVEFIKTTSFGIHHQIIDDQNALAAEAHDIIVIYDFNTNEKIAFPDELRKEIELLEKKTF
jgi:acyl-CoA thioester hydrolase